MSDFYPQKIICMTEESVETLYAIGREDLIAGVSVYVERPPQAKKNHPKISAFTHANLKKIISKDPDLVLGYSDIQKDIARDLIGEGLNVFISNHRSVDGILNYIQLLGNMVGEVDATSSLITSLKSKLAEARKFSNSLKCRPRVYIEEWDEPMICGIRWFSEVIELCGGEVIHHDESMGSLAKDRFVSSEFVISKDPEIIFACWCGKKVDKESIVKRDGWSEVSAVRNSQVFELDPAIFLQPGPAPISAGIDIIIDYFTQFANK